MEASATGMELSYPLDAGRPDLKRLLVQNHFDLVSGRGDVRAIDARRVLDESNEGERQSVGRAERRIVEVGAADAAEGGTGSHLPVEVGAEICEDGGTAGGAGSAGAHPAAEDDVRVEADECFGVDRLGDTGIVSAPWRAGGRGLQFAAEEDAERALRRDA